MKYERFSELWEALVTNRPKAAEASPITNGMQPETAAALVDYSNDNKTKIEEVKRFLATAAV